MTQTPRNVYSKGYEYIFDLNRAPCLFLDFKRLYFIEQDLVNQLFTDPTLSLGLDKRRVPAQEQGSCMEYEETFNVPPWKDGKVQRRKSETHE